jgi:hypothetical protein
MHTVEIKTMKGCQSSIDFRKYLEDFFRKNHLDIEIIFTLVSSLTKAADAGLYGSPTILLNGTEYQEERRGPPGFY